MHKNPLHTKPKALIIVGPTASGKSALAVELAKRFDGEIISADSRQVYRGLDIGTGKITKREMGGVPHYLLDIASPKRVVTAQAFSTKARAAMRQIEARGKLPIVVGGTGFYIDALFGRIRLPDVAPDNALRKRLHGKTTAQLYSLLKKKDPRRAASMNTPSERNNKVRLIRALEIAAHAKGDLVATSDPLWNALWIGIAPPFATLERKIATRLRVRIRRGMIAEAKRLHAQGLSYKRMENLGLEYRSLSRLLRGELTRQAFEEALLRDIRRYARKQLVYWKRNADIHWYDSKQKKSIECDVAAWLEMS